MRAIIRAVKSILNGFTNLIDFIQTIFKILGNVLQQIVYLIKYILQAINISTSFITTLPAWLSVFATITVSISVLYILLGRSTGSKGGK